MDYELAYSLLKLAMDTPEVIDDLWLAKESRFSSEDHIACTRLLERLEVDRTLEEKITYEINNNAAQYLDFLWNPKGYPPDLLVEATRCCPPARAKLAYVVPSGFQPRWNPIGWLEKRQFDMKIRLCPPGHRLPSLIIYNPALTERQFPWQQADAANIFLRKENHQPISSRYTKVAGVKAYEFCFRSKNLDWWELGQMLSLEYAMIPLIIKGGKECRLVLSTRSLAVDKPIFDQFIASFY